MPQGEASDDIDPESVDDGPAPVAPVRRCLVTGERNKRETLLRFVLDPDDRVVFDAGSALPGRGFWLSPKRDVLQTAVSKRLFSKAARRSVSLPDGLADEVERQLARRAIDLLSLARRGGGAVAGQEKVVQALLAGKAGLLVQAMDGAPDGRAKVASRASGLSRAVALSAAELGSAFGRDGCVHVVLAPGPLARRVETEMLRLRAFRGIAADD